MTKQPWEEEFDKEFVKNNGEFIAETFWDKSDAGPVKSFIRSTLAQERQKVNEEWKEKIKNQKVIAITERGECCEAYIRAIEDLLK